MKYRCKQLIVLMALCLSLLLFLPQAHAQQAGLYWFQVGTSTIVATTGAAVDIKIVQQTPPADGSTLAFWAGIDLPNDAFFQVGYLSCCNERIPNSFWTYFPPGKASEGVGGVSAGVATLTVNSWVHFSLTSNGNIWTAYVNNSPVESVNLGISYGNRATAILEDASASSGDNIVHAVEFKNLQYRDSSGWHSASLGIAISGYGAGSAKYAGEFPYGLQSTVGVNNDWVAGSGLPVVQSGQELWPWRHVNGDWMLDGAIYTPNDSMTVPISRTSRLRLAGYEVNGEPQLGVYDVFVDQDMVVKPIYVKQFFLHVNSTLGTTVSGSGWYDAGSTASIRVVPEDYGWDAFGLLKFRFWGWSGSNGYSSSSSVGVVTVTEPMTVTANYVLDPFSPLILAILFVLVGSAIFMLVHKRRTKVVT